MRHKVWLDAGGRFALGDGGVELLRAIGATGSIRAAAAQVGWSYRHALAYLDNADAALSRPLVDRARGGMERGGARLTDEGLRLIRRYGAFRQQLDAVFRQLTRSVIGALEVRARGTSSKARSAR